MQHISYRKLGKDEIDLIINNRIAFLYELQGKPSPDRELKLRETLAGYFRKALQDGSFVGWIAEVDNKIAGSGGMVIQQIPGHFNIISGRIGYILNIYTLPEYRNRGIASGIVDRLIEEGEQLGLDKVYLHASQDGIEIYRKKGFCEPDLPELELKL
jgi:ribosomal protein S18 acetylase RimI-like enzyme